MVPPSKSLIFRELVSGLMLNFIGFSEFVFCVEGGRMNTILAKFQ